MRDQLLACYPRFPHFLHLKLQHDRQELFQSDGYRRSVEERYESREQYLEWVTQSARELIEEGYLLDEDLNEIVGGARRSWNDLVESTQ